MTHFPASTYNKNWAFYSEELWKIRWDQILSMGSDLNFIEIITWNDFGESHYIGPYDTPHTDDGSSAWASGLDHTAMLDMAVPYINAFKAGQTTVTVQDEMLVYWYRPHLKSAECDSTDLCGAKPTGWDFLEDSVFVTAMTISGGTVTVTSGSNAAVTTTVGAGVQIFQVPMGVGTQSFSFQTNSGGSGSGSGNVSISADCWVSGRNAGAAATAAAASTTFLPYCLRRGNVAPRLTLTERQLQLQLPLGEHHRLTKSSRPGRLWLNTAPAHNVGGTEFVVAHRGKAGRSGIAHSQSHDHRRFHFSISVSFQSQFQLLLLAFALSSALLPLLHPLSPLALLANPLAACSALRATDLLSLRFEHSCQRAVTYLESSDPRSATNRMNLIILSPSDRERASGSPGDQQSAWLLR